MEINIRMAPHVATLHTDMMHRPGWHLDTFGWSYSSKCPDFRVILADFHYRFLGLDFVFYGFVIKILWIFWSHGSPFAGTCMSYPKMCLLPKQLRIKGHIWPINHRQVITDKNCTFFWYFPHISKIEPCWRKIHCSSPRTWWQDLKPLWETKPGLYRTFQSDVRPPGRSATWEKNLVSRN